MTTILYIDDEPLIQEASKSYLEESGFVVDVVTSGTEAFEKLYSNEYDAIISDYQMPGMNGIDILKRVRLEFGKIPFILFTGKGREEVVIEAIENGVDYYIQKGSDVVPLFTDLIYKINLAINKRQSEINLQNKEKVLAEKNAELLQAFEKIATNEEELKQQIEEIRIAHQIMYKSEQKYKKLFDENILGTALHEIICDESGVPINYRFLDVNPAFERMTNLKASNIIGKTVLDALPDTEPYWIQTYGNVALSGVPHFFERYSGELQKFFEVYAYSPIPGQFVTIVQDVTTRKLNEQQLRESKEYHEKLISYANVPIIVWDPDFIISRINHSFEDLIGRKSEEVVGKSIEILFPPDHSAFALRLIRTTNEGVRWESVEIPLQHKNGDIRIVLWNSATIYGHDGITPIATIAQGRDITHERQLEIEKEAATIQIQQNIAKLAILNDGIRNPLSIILSYVELSMDESLNELMSNEIKRIDDMVTNLDQEWTKSEKILDYLIKHGKISTHNIVDTVSESPLNCIYEKTGTPGSFLLSSSGLLLEEIQAQLYSILDGIDALIYVIDMDCHEILYANKNCVRLFGNITGKKCYHIFQEGMNGECPFCSNSNFRNSTDLNYVHRYENYISKTNRWYDCHDRAIRWTNGNIVRLSIASDISEQKKLRETEDFLLRSDYLHRGENFFQSIAHHLAETLQMEFVFIDRLEGEKQIARTVTIYSQGEFPENITYSLEDTPCGKVVGKTICVFPEHVQQLFPKDLILQHIGAESYIGTTLWGFDGNPIGLIAVVGKNALTNPGFAESILKMVAVRAAGELERKEKEDIIEKNEIRYRQISEIITDFAYSCKEGDGGVYSIDWLVGAVEQITGYTRDEIFQSSCWRFLVLDEDIPLFDRYVTGLSPGESGSCDLRIRRQDGHIIWLTSYARCMPDSTDPTTHRLIGACRDVSSQKRMQNKVRDHERTYSTLVSNLPGFVYQCVNDTQWTMNLMSNGCLDVTGYAPEDFIENKNLCFSDIVHPDYQQPLWEKWQTILAEKGVFEEVYPIISKNGEIRWVWERGRGVFSDEDILLHLEGFITDITEKKKIEDQLKRSEEKFSASFGINPDPVAITEIETGTIVDVNPSFSSWSGYGMNELIGKRTVDLSFWIHPKERDDIIVSLNRHENVLNKLVSLNVKSGDIRECLFSASFIRFGEKDYLFTQAHDVTEQKRTEKELKDAREWLGITLRAAKAGTWDWDFITGKLKWSPEFFELFGIPQNTEASFDTWLDVIHPDDKDQAIVKIERTVQEHAPLWNEYRIILPDSSIRWIGAAGNTIYDDAGQPLRMSGVCIDITERKKTETQINLQLIRLKSFLTLLGMVDASEQEIMDYALETSLLITDCQYAFVGLLTPDESEMIIHSWSKNAMDICRVMEKPIHFPIDKAGIWGECIRNRAPSIINSYSAHHPAKHGYPEGHVQITSYLGVPIFDGEKIVAIIAVANKKTDYQDEDVNSLMMLGNLMWEMMYRKRATDALRQKGIYNRVLIETSLDPLVTIGADGKITDVNTATEIATGYLRDELIGSDFSDYFTEPDLAQNGYLQVFEYGQIRDYPLSLKHKNGSVRSVFYNASVYTNEKGEIAGIFAAARDITDRKQMEEALQRSNKEIKLLTGLTRHDIMNALSAIEINLVLAQSAEDLQMIQKYLSASQEAIKRIGTLIGFTKQFESLGSCGSGWNSVYADIESAKKEISTGDIMIQNLVPENLEIYADPIIQKVFSTLLDNSIRHGKTLTKIRFSATEKDHSVIITCEDDGTGIADEEKKCIFDHGYGSNTGIGLFLAQEILAITGLSIMETGEEGTGARFEILVPEGKYRYI